MWTEVYIAKSNELAQKLKDMLNEHNIIVMLEAVNKDDDTTGFKVLVPVAEVEEALGIIIDET